MHEPKTWIIAANGDTARIFDYLGRNRPSVPLKDHVWHAPEIAEFDDAQGVTHSSVGHSQHRMANHSGPDKQSGAFATMIAENLAAAEKSGAFERLILIAAPRMMGLLRDRLDVAVLEKIWSEIDKDLTHLPLEKIDNAVKAQLFS